MLVSLENGRLICDKILTRIIDKESDRMLAPRFAPPTYAFPSTRPSPEPPGLPPLDI